MPYEIFEQKPFTRLFSVNSMSELQIFTPFSVCYKDSLYKF